LSSKIFVFGKDFFISAFSITSEVIDFQNASGAKLLRQEFTDATEIQIGSVPFAAGVGGFAARRAFVR
jgi:hypothetical protein